MVPDSIISKCNDFVISKTGRDFFDKYISFNYQSSQKTGDKYYINYIYRDLDKEYIDEKITFMVDTTGSVLKNLEISGIPEVKKHPEQCEFNLRKDQAVDIAIAEELPEGVGEWQVSFRWSAEFKRYVWHILTTISEMGSGDNYKAKGEEIILSPANGDIIARREWNIR